MICPHCGREHSDLDKFCCVTGLRISTLLACCNHNCRIFGQPIIPTFAHFCPECGKSLDCTDTFTSDLDFIVNGVPFKMIHVEGGTFTMGATSKLEEPDYDETPTHEVTLSSYFIGETPVTQALWKSVMGYNNSDFKGNDHPVEMVNWDECQEFLVKLNLRTGKRFRLLTEAEWEFAARGGKKSRGFVYSGSDTVDEVAWYDDDEIGKVSTHPVKQKKPNELGIYDMSGNVNEWCEDWYDDYWFDPLTNPKGPSSGSYRVFRGGGWNQIDNACRVSWRGRREPNGLFDSDLPSTYSQLNNLGLRLALSE